MEFVTYTDPQQFSLKAKPILTQHEDTFSLFYGIMEAIKAGRYDNPFMAAVEEDGEITALLQMTPPYPLNIIVNHPEKADEILGQTVRLLAEQSISIPTVISRKEWAISFAEKWKAETGRGFQVEIDEGVYRLDAVNSALEDSPGNWRLATKKDALRIAAWLMLFEKEAGLPLTPKDAVREEVASFIDRQEVFVWENEGKVVSMMKKARPTERGVTVSMVFTPRQERRKGYGRTMVAKVSEELMKEFQFCLLFTDLANATANKIYQEIGYMQIADFAVVELD
ncbi:GNAT family N-acetyltransferase [Sporosarcina cascadiensis]|uniref:GNAT family N-acetyltransferase n=1 Tax=Sporosarcina cascadiensis TaxID=2660747 RepID=UPI00129A1FFE|nr:GNAT family N-acetyltransferase [Sporosarcina cascadiensis]